jgi:hypothetical protein
MKHPIKLLTLLLLAPLVALHAAEPVTPPGDRNLPINQIYPPEAFYHNGKGGRVLDVTKAPFNAKGDGKTDDTKALCAAMRFLLANREQIKGVDREGKPYSYFDAKYAGDAWIMYLPDGEYLVSDTISTGWPAKAYDIKQGWGNAAWNTITSPEAETADLQLRGELNYFLRIEGQSRAKTIIRLKDHCPGFEAGKLKKVLTYHLLKCGSSANNGNDLQNLTIHTGKGNPGAVGLAWDSSDWGRLYNLAIISGDGSGRAGLMMESRNAHGYHRDLLIDGFDVGIEAIAVNVNHITLEYATLKNQRQVAIRMGRGMQFSMSARKVLTQNAPVAMKVAKCAQLVLIESELNGSGSGGSAISIDAYGALLARDVALSGYGAAIEADGKVVLAENTIQETVVGKAVSAVEGVPARTLRLPVKESPVILPESDLSKWANVDEFGAKGDGLTDDTEAVQRAMNSGKPVVWFPKAHYAINGSVDIPSSVREVNFLAAAIYRRDPKQKPDLTTKEAIALAIVGEPAEAKRSALFRVSKTSKEPLLLHQSLTLGGVFFDHEALRPVVLEDLAVFHFFQRYKAARNDMLFPGSVAMHTSGHRLYRNASPEGEPKEVFVNNVMGFGVGGENGTLGVENVHAWVRSMQNLHQPIEWAFRNSTVWCLGFKTEYGENPTTTFHLSDRTQFEALGGIQHVRHKTTEVPMIISRDSRLSMSFVTFGGSKGVPYTVLLQAEDNGESTKILDSQFDRRRSEMPGETMVPLLTNSPK